MKKVSGFLIGILLCFVNISVFAQVGNEIWSRVDPSEAKSTDALYSRGSPVSFEIYEIDFKNLRKKLHSAPSREFSSHQQGNIIPFPNENGVMELFMVFRADIMEPELQLQYPNIQSYVGKSIDNPGSLVRFSLSQIGIHAMLLNSTGKTFYIDSNSSSNERCIAYSRSELERKTAFVCRFDEINHKVERIKSDHSSRPLIVDDGNLRVYRLAVATTGEYAQYHLNNQGIPNNATDEVKKAAVLAEINVVMTRVNGIFERDVGLTMQLVANNEEIIFLDAETDGFTNDDLTVLINESQTVIDGTIGSPNYDIGHTLGTDGGGLAQLYSPCTNNKARGVTGIPNPIGDGFYVDYVSHEMGHQFGANHTYNSGASNCLDNRNDDTAVEPGSGSTIMSYSGLCAPDNIQSASDDYFHQVSIGEMWDNISSGWSSSCAGLLGTGNSAPVVQPLNNYTIPIGTPFVLDAVATDAQGDDLTYSWEQLDEEITTAPPVPTSTQGPAFRSLPPDASSMRYFPNMSTVLSGNTGNTWEMLPSVSRTMNFGVIVRDNNPSGGQAASEEVTITFDNGAGPFQISSQNVTESWDIGTSQTITWDIANTNIPPISCSSVDNGVGPFQIISRKCHNLIETTIGIIGEVVNYVTRRT